MNDKTFKIFVDFDGTITKNDVGEAMFLKFGNPERAREIIEDWINEKINAKVSWQLLCDTLIGFDELKFGEFLNAMDIDTTFKEFVGYCKSNDFEIRILSDGLSYYIDHILKREGLSHLEVYSNRVSNQNGKLIPQFPHTDSECDRCANCKRNHILNFSSDDEYSVYIGDGWSDVCPAQFCDFIFAKNSLLKYCESNRITYFPFGNFSDVIKKMDQLKVKKRLKKRHQAELKRKEIYIQG
ncbi:MAG TPA: MtnX-like HAD-IB family phosphatase [Melioribacteraceae bacterium]|nr:MtnX-like HAD-IB family phosphatase [Melioribacteraceae bacterium]